MAARGNSSPFRQLPLARAIAVALSLLPLAAVAPCAAAEREPAASTASARARSHDFDIPAQNLRTALHAFSIQSGVQISVYDPVVAGKRSPTIRGRYTETQVLDLLLRGSGVQYTVSGGRKRRTYSFTLQETARATAPDTQRAQRGRLRSTQADPDQADSGREPGLLGTQRVDARRIEATKVTTGELRFTIDREDVERSGFATLYDVVSTTTQNFEGGATQDTFLGREAQTNAASGTALNLRGLGGGATIPLLDGRRLAPGGSEGLFSDISMLPASAIERIDIVADGASIAHGPDAVGGIVNFVTRKGYDGAETRLHSGLATDGGATERMVSQLLGTSWESGNGVLAYEYHERDALHAREREFTARSDLTALGGDNFDSSHGNPGNIRVGNLIFAIPAGQDGSALAPDDFVAGTVNRSNRNVANDVLPGQQRHSVFGTLSQEVGNHLVLFADAVYSQRDARSSRGGFATTLTVPESNAFYVNPTGGTGPLRIAYDFGDDIGARVITTTQEAFNAALGGTIGLSDTWKATLELGAARERLVQRTDNLVDMLALANALADPNPATAFNAFGDGSHTSAGTLATLSASAHFAMDSQIGHVSVNLDGALWRVAGRDVRLALGAEARRQKFDSVTDARALGFPRAGSRYSRDVSAAFAQVLVPVIATPHDEICCNRLDLSLAARGESYSDGRTRISPKLGLEWAPFAGVALRGTWSNSYRAPNLIDLDETSNGSVIFEIPDPLAHSGVSPALVWFGRSRDLSEETARTRTLGASFVPAALPRTRIAVTWFDIEFEDRVREIPPVITFLTDPMFASIVTRDPTPAQRAAVCARTTFFGQPDDCRNAPIGSIVDARLLNTATTHTRGIDLFAAHEMPAAIGTVTAELEATRVLAFEEAWGDDAPTVSTLDRQHNPLAFRGRASLTWEHRGFGAAAQLRYAGAYSDTASEPDRPVGSWTTVDLWLGYRFGTDHPGILANTAVSVNVQNVLDEDPPFLNNPRGIGYDEENANPIGRFASLQIRKSW